MAETRRLRGRDESPFSSWYPYIFVKPRRPGRKYLFSYWCQFCPWISCLLRERSTSRAPCFQSPFKCHRNFSDSASQGLGLPVEALVNVISMQPTPHLLFEDHGLRAFQDFHGKLMSVMREKLKICHIYGTFTVTDVFVLSEGILNGYISYLAQGNCSRFVVSAISRT